MRVIKPTMATPRLPTWKKVFLAGSIEMGRAKPWQDELAKDFKPFDTLFFNPRRDDWDSSWEQDINNPKFYEQVSWEMNSIDVSHIVFFYFQPDTISPITLLELGYVIGGLKKGKKCVVCCPEGFHRKGNVDIICQRVGVPVFEDLDTAKVALKNLIRN